MARLAFTVIGRPAPQGSKRHVGRGIMVESSKAVKPWRQDVTAAARDALEAWYPGEWPGTDGRPLALFVTFRLPRPKGHYGTGRNGGNLKASAPSVPTTTPDLDKLQRSTLDALVTAGVMRDDSQVVQIAAFKEYETTAHPVGAFVEVSDLL